jgi:alpha-galactosidase
VTAPVKISLIGAGSGVFSLGILRDLVNTAGLHGSLVSFMDISPERLDAVYEVARRFAAELEVRLEFEKTLDRRQSLDGADFVINSAMVVGHDKRHFAQEIGQKWGYSRGPRVGGSYHQFKLFQDIVRDIEEICPNAWYIQSANPVFDGCTLLTRTSKAKIVGLCHGQHGVNRIARVIGLDPAKLEAQSHGLNHFIWLTKFMYEGKDAYPLIDEWIETKAEAFWASPECDIGDQMGPKCVDVYKRLGLFPIGDTATPGGGSYFRWYHTDKATEQKWGEDPIRWFDRHVERVNARVDDIVRVAADPSVKVTSVFPTTKTSESNVAIIDAIANDKPGIFQVNIPNNGCIPSVADDVVVEVPGLVSGAGIQGVHMGDLPPRIMFHLVEKIIQMERGIDAYLTGDRRMLLESILANPETKTIDQACGVLEDTLALPFNREMAAHYR